MKKIIFPFCSFLLLFLVACANVVPPSGGPKDVTPPKLVSVSPADSQLNTRVTTLRLTFDEFLTLNNPAQQIQLSPLLPVPLDVSLKRKTVTVRIPDSLLRPNTSYQLSFGTAIQDLHEGNPFQGFNYLFSTGPYFDSLMLEGRVFDAATGLPDTTAQVLLYDATGNDSAVIRQKPLYVTHVDAAGRFRLKGLPELDFRVYALQDLNNNLIYDGGSERIAFQNTPVRPAADTVLSVSLYLFRAANADTTKTSMATTDGRKAPLTPAPSRRKEEQGYQVLADTSNSRARTFDLNKDLNVQLMQPPTAVRPERIFLSYDSSGITTEALTTISTDSLNRIQIHTGWKEDALYELRLQKGFATDSAGNDLLPGIYRFRTKRNEDYGTIRLQVPGRYQGPEYLLEIFGPGEQTLFYRKPISDTLLSFQRLLPGSYLIRIIHDVNQNGVWDSGTLFPPRQPERVLPYPANPIRIREGWEHEIDFEQGN